MSSIEYRVTGMTCGHCERSVREEVTQLQGVEDVIVTARTGQLLVTAQGAIDDDAVLAAVEEAGYTAARA